MPYPTNLFGRHFLACYLLLYVVTPHKGNNMLLMTILFACGEDTKTDDTSTQDTAETSDTSDTFDTAEIEVSNVGPAGLSSSENSCAPNDGWALDIKVGLENVDECLGDIPDDFWMHFTIYPSDFTSNSEISLGLSGGESGTGFFQYSGSTNYIVEGTIRLDWDGDWELKK